MLSRLQIQALRKYKDRELRTRLPAFQPRVESLELRISWSIPSLSRQDGDQFISRSISKNDQIFASWDSSCADEKVNWCKEYMARHAPLSLNWLPRPVDVSKRPEKIRQGIRGFGLKYNKDERIMIATLDDGSVCPWNIDRSNELVPSAKSGQIMACSKPGLLITSLLCSGGDYGPRKASNTKGRFGSRRSD